MRGRLRTRSGKVCLLLVIVNVERLKVEMHFAIARGLSPLPDEDAPSSSKDDTAPQSQKSDTKSKPKDAKPSLSFSSTPTSSSTSALAKGKGKKRKVGDIGVKDNLNELVYRETDKQSRVKAGGDVGNGKEKKRAKKTKAKTGALLSFGDDG